MNGREEQALFDAVYYNIVYGVLEETYKSLQEKGLMEKDSYKVSAIGRLVASTLTEFK